MTLDEYFDSTPNLKLLRENLETNLKATTDLTQGEMDSLMRVNLTVIRQAMEDKINFREIPTRMFKCVGCSHFFKTAETGNHECDPDSNYKWMFVK